MSKMVINAKKFSDVVLVYDQYYAQKPKAALLVLERVALCCGVCFCAMMFLLAEYQFPVSSLLVGGLSVLFSAGFSLLFVFVKKRFAIPAVVVICALIWLFSREKIVEKLSYFMDALWLLMDGRFIPGKILVDHELDMLTPQSLMYCEGTAFGFGLIVFLFSMITAACLMPKPHILPSLFSWIVLWVPVLVSEKFTFTPWIIPALAIYMGAFALASVYGQGIALDKGIGGSYRGAAVRGERSFTNSLARVPYLKQVEMRTVYYSKYFSAVMYAMAVFAALGIVVGGVFSASEGIDYSKLYEFVISLSEHSPITNPFEKDVSSEWFTDPVTEGSNQVQSLSITNPGRGNQEILRVKNTGESVVYLRGDIGIDFTGESWTSPVNDEPKEWKTSGLSDYYRPVEVQVLMTLQGMLFSDTRTYSVASADVTVDYLCDSTVTFLPAYTSDLGHFDNEMFNIYGDFVARVNDSYDRMDSVHCTALVPNYTNMDDSSAEDGLESLRRAANLAHSHGGISDIINNRYFTGHPQALTDYRSYVYNTYLNVPEEYKVLIRDYINKSGFWGRASGLSAEGDEIVKRYLIASEVADYLRTNYTYSLNTNNSGVNPLNSFLNVTKSGHCAMYASSMTLILREMGIPARYCTGFVVSPTGEKETVLRSKNLHAWVEVYLNELGWVTFDPTSSSQTGGNPGEISRPDESNPELNSSTTESSESSETSSDDSSENEDSNSENENSDDDGENSTSSESPEIPQSDNNDKTIITIVIIAVSFTMVTAALIYCVGAMKKLDNRIKRTLKDARTKGDCVELYAKITEIIKLCGFVQRPGEQPKNYFRRVDGHLKTKLAEHTNLLLKDAFCEGEFSANDLRETAALLESVFYAAKKQLVLIGIIKLYSIILRSKV